MQRIAQVSFITGTHQSNAEVVTLNVCQHWRRQQSCILMEWCRFVTYLWNDPHTSEHLLPNPILTGQ